MRICNAIQNTYHFDRGVDISTERSKSSQRAFMEKLKEPLFLYTINSPLNPSKSVNPLYPCSQVAEGF